MRLPTGGFESRAATRGRAEPLRRGRSRRRFAARDDDCRRDRPGEPPATTRGARTGFRRAPPLGNGEGTTRDWAPPFWCDASDASNAPVASDVAAVKRCASLKRVSTRFLPVCHRGYSRTRDISPFWVGCTGSPVGMLKKGFLARLRSCTRARSEGRVTHHYDRKWAREAERG